MGTTGAQALIQEGIVQGELQARQEALMEFMRGRFGSIPPQVENSIQAIQDTDRLKTLIRRVSRVTSLDEIDIE